MGRGIGGLVGIKTGSVVGDGAGLLVGRGAGVIVCAGMGCIVAGAGGQIRSCSLLHTGSVESHAMDPQQTYDAGAMHAEQGPSRSAGNVAVQAPPPVSQYTWRLTPSPALASFAGQRL